MKKQSKHGSSSTVIQLDGDGLTNLILDTFLPGVLKDGYIFSIFQTLISFFLTLLPFLCCAGCCWCCGCIGGGGRGGGGDSGGGGSGDSRGNHQITQIGPAKEYSKNHNWVEDTSEFSTPMCIGGGGA